MLSHAETLIKGELKPEPSKLLVTAHDRGAQAAFNMTRKFHSAFQWNLFVETDLLAYETCLVISKYPRQENQLIRIMCIRAGIISVSVKTFVMKF